jgi:hypothetical protein
VSSVGLATEGTRETLVTDDGSHPQSPPQHVSAIRSRPGHQVTRAAMTPPRPQQTAPCTSSVQGGPYYISTTALAQMTATGAETKRIARTEIRRERSESAAGQKAPVPLHDWDTVVMCIRQNLEGRASSATRICADRPCSFLTAEIGQPLRRNRRITQPVAHPGHRCVICIVWTPDDTTARRRRSTSTAARLSNRSHSTKTKRQVRQA